MSIPFNEDLLNKTMGELFDEAKERYVEEHNTEEAYEETLNEAYGTVMICGFEYEQGTVLKELDPIGFRCGVNDESDRYYEMFDEDNDIEDFRDQALEALNMEDDGY